MVGFTNFQDLFEDKKILITGGLGSIGSELVIQLFEFNPKEIRVLDNREIELFHFWRNFRDNNNLRIIFGDVREKERMSQAIDEIDIVFHVAAMKHVLICEQNPFEVVKTNVIGTQNVIECVLEHNVERMILISTDKAVNPTNVMGATKLLAERLVSAACNYRNNKATKFGVVRFGNVLASRGSVLEIWEKQLSEGRKITITDPNMTRFFMSIPESVRLIFHATYHAENGETFILKMPSVRIVNLAEAFLELKGYDSNYYEVIGANIGEKIHEELISESEANFLMENEQMLVRFPLTFDLDKIFKRFEQKGFKKTKIKKLISNDERFLLKKDEIKKVLDEIHYNRKCRRNVK